MVKSSKGVFDLGFENIGLDFSYSSPQQVSADHLQLFFNGTLFDMTSGEYAPKTGFANMSVNHNTTESIQIGLSEQMLDSGAYVLHNKDLL